MSNEDFWLSTPYVLMNKDYIGKVYPKKEYSTIENLNSITRLIIVLSILGFFISRDKKIVLLGVLSLAVIVGYYYKDTKNSLKRELTKESFGLLDDINIGKEKEKKEELYQPRKNNPLMNVLLPEIQYIPKRQAAAPVHNENVIKEVNKKTIESLDDKIFKDLGDDILFNQGMRDFYTNPATTIPNNQDAFVQFCYGSMKSCKEGDEPNCDSKNYRHILR